VKTLASLFRLGLCLLKLEVGVPRRFGLAALLVVIGCFGVLCALLAHLNTHWFLVEVICVMLLGIGTLQMLRGPAKARQSSILVGSVTMALVGVIGALLNPPNSRSSGILVFCVWTILGPGAGYLGGLLVAGVFLIVDVVNRWFDGTAISATESLSQVARDSPSGGVVPIASPPAPSLSTTNHGGASPGASGEGCDCG
jgi:hypothetical protein